MNVNLAQQAAGVAATAKHFPGLGSATKTQNTDTGPVTLTASLTKLRTLDEVPYLAAARRAFPRDHRAGTARP
jgi:beta-N-acetylhexosaminidase